MYKLLPLALTGFFSSTLIAGSTSEASMEYRLESALLHDSNLDIDALDRSAKSGDSALRTKAAVNGQWQSKSGFGVSGGYQATADKYRDNNAFDTLTQLASADMYYSGGPVTLGASYHYADAELDSRDFMVLQQRSLYAGMQASQKWYWRVAWTKQNKDFTALNDYDADNRGLGGDIYHFYTRKSFVAFSLVETDEDALNDALDYSGWRAKLQWQHNTEWFSLPTRLQASWQHQLRDYRTSASLSDVPVDGPLGGLLGASSPPPQNASQREDRRDSLSLQVETAVNTILRITGSLEYSDNRSSLESANYDEVVSTVGLALVF